MTTMNQESFAQLFEESLAHIDMRPGALLKAKVVNITPDWVIVDAGLKAEGVIAKEEFVDLQGNLEVSLGDEVEVILDDIEDGRLSREKAKRAEAWAELVRAHEDNRSVLGTIVGRVKGGFTVEVQNIRAFLPGSLVDVRPIRDTSHLEGKELDFKVIKIDQRRNNVVVSRRAIIEKENTEERNAILEKLHEGQEVKGTVKNLTDYGAFVDLGGVDGLLHITDMSWKRIRHPNEIVSVGEEINVKVLKFDRDRGRVSLGLKQLGSDPWSAIKDRFPLGEKLRGKVTNITDYGCFVEIAPGVEGLVHMSEMDWTNKNIHPSKVVQLGDEVDVIVLEVDEERRRVSLGMKQCHANPWKIFADKFNKGDVISGKIKSITDFGIFVGLEGNIDGLVHASDISWTTSGEDAIRNYKKGEDVEAIILAIDPERERVSLGIKQLQGDAFNDYAETHPKGDVVTGEVTEIAAKQVIVKLAEDVLGQIRVADLTKEKVEDPNSVCKVGDSITAKITNVDRKTRVISLSVKALEAGSKTKESKKSVRSGEPSIAQTTLGDILKEQMNQKSDSAE